MHRVLGFGFKVYRVLVLGVWILASGFGELWFGGRSVCFGYR